MRNCMELHYIKHKACVVTHTDVPFLPKGSAEHNISFAQVLLFGCDKFEISSKLCQSDA